MCYQECVEYLIDPIAVEASAFMREICLRHKLSFDESVGIPMLDEGQRVGSLWSSLQKASEYSSSKQLFVAFINQRAIDGEAVLASNLKTLDYFSVPHDLRFSLNPLGKDFLLVINGTHSCFHFKDNEGVGRARKVPADLCLMLWKEGILKTEKHRQTDADVVVPSAYFSINLKADEVAATYAYVHSQGELNTEEFQALQHYERWLASYCEGLEYAESPYAYWALGSTLYFRLSAYEKIRGVPNVRAGEDFHFLAKLRKLGKVTRLRTPILEIRGRHSTRVPFGTGRALENMRESKKNYALYPQEIFEELRRVLISLNELAEHKSLERFFEEMDSLSRIFFEAHKKVFLNILSQGSSAEQKRKLLNESFDALATLRWVNQRYQNKISD